MAHEDEKREYEAGSMSASKKRIYLKKCQKEVANMPDVVRNYFCARRHDVPAETPIVGGSDFDENKSSELLGKLVSECDIA